MIRERATLLHYTYIVCIVESWLREFLKLISQPIEILVELR